MDDNKFTNANGDILTREEWQEQVGFYFPKGYYVKIFRGRGKFEYKNYNTYPEALCAALYLEQYKHEKAMLYVQTENHAFMVPEHDMPKYLKLYNQFHGVRYGMPTWYKPKVKYGKQR
jgi:hypothetical protein